MDFPLKFRKSKTLTKSFGALEIDSKNEINSTQLNSFNWKNLSQQYGFFFSFIFAFHYLNYNGFRNTQTHRDTRALQILYLYFFYVYFSLAKHFSYRTMNTHIALRIGDCNELLCACKSEQIDRNETHTEEGETGT